MESAAKAVAVRTPANEEAPATPTAEMSPTNGTAAVSPVTRAASSKFVDRQLLLTPATDAALSRLVELFRRTTGTKLSTSHVARALLKGVAHSMQTLEREARRLGPMKLPSNARAFEADRERFEARLADAFVAGIRSAAAFDGDE
jgi:hypothetical protein